MHNTVTAIVEEIRATCPTCQHATQFHLLGTQKWPAAVTARFNLPTVIGLYRCDACNTTISEIDLARQHQ